MSDNTKTRREREEALIHAARTDDENCHDRTLARALEAAHRREDAIRKLKRYEKGFDGRIVASDYGILLWVDDVISILDGDA